MARPRSVAEEYHRLTKYSAESIRALPGVDWDTQPPQFKEIVASRRVSLRDLHPLGALGRILFHGNGVTGMIKVQRGGGQYLRASPSAGALYPTEIYVALRDLPDVEAGLYNYQVQKHELVRLWEGDLLAEIQAACGGDPVFLRASACLVLTGVYWRSAWRYQERGYRRVLLDTGHVLANLVAYAPHEGFCAHALTGFCDAALSGLFFFDECVESPLVCVPLLEEEAAPGPAQLWSSATTEADGLSIKTMRGVSDLAGSATCALHRSSSCAEPLPVAAPAVDPTPGGAIPLARARDIQEAIPTAIVNRRSARNYAAEPISLENLGQALGFAFAPCATRDAGLLRAHLAALRVDGLDSGTYAIEGAGEALRPIALGDFRQELHYLALGQNIANGCAAVLFFTAPATASLALYGDRAYRYLHLEAGAIGERFQLAATALGLSACGIAGFFDDEAARLLEMDREDFVLYLVMIGRS